MKMTIYHELEAQFSNTPLFIKYKMQKIVSKKSIFISNKIVYAWQFFQLSVTTFLGALKRAFFYLLIQSGPLAPPRNFSRLDAMGTQWA
jgi:hypothetical protein